MKKKTAVLTAIAFWIVMVVGAPLALADVNADAAASAAQSQTQQQNQQQQQRLVNTTTATGGAGGNGGNVNGSVVMTSPREHIQAPAGPSGNFVGAPETPFSDGWEELTCQPLLQVFTLEQLESAAGGGKVKSVLRQKKVKESDGAPVVRLDWIPEGFGDVLLGEFIVEGKNGQGILAPLSRAVLAAKEATNTHRVFVWVKLKKGAKNSGLSIGSGAAGGKLWGPDSAAGAVALGGLIGTTWASITEAMVVKVWAFNDGSITPPPGLEVCGVYYAPAPPAPTTLPAIREEAVEPACNPIPILDRILGLNEKIRACTRFCVNNLQLRKEMGDELVRLFVCTGEKKNLQSAISQYEIAEKNYRHGWDISSHQAEADGVIAQVYYNWAGVICELYGSERAKEFAKEKKLERFPQGIAR